MGASQRVVLTIPVGRARLIVKGVGHQQKKGTISYDKEIKASQASILGSFFPLSIGRFKLT